MSMGICMKAFNSIHFRSKIDFFFEFIPQIILLNVIFGYMDILIISKWLYPFNLYWTTEKEYSDLSGAPSVITCMINMFLKIGTAPEDYSPAMIRVLPY